MARPRPARLLAALALLPALVVPVAGSAPARGAGSGSADPGEAGEGATLLGRAGPVETRVRLEIEHPSDGAITGERAGAYVAGRALASVGELRRFDVTLVLDTSKSASRMTGSDVNGNGVVGVRGPFGNTDPGDSILAVEVAASKRLLRGLDPEYARASLVTFAGRPSGRGGVLFGREAGAAAHVEVPLTGDFEAVAAGLERVLERGAHGLTDMAAGLERARVELLGRERAASEPEPESEKVVLFFTDGQPTLSEDAVFEAENLRAVLRAADRLAESGIRVHSFAIGEEALEGPVATVEASARTGGTFTPVRDPADLVDVMRTVSFARLEEIRVRNATTGQEATDLRADADGSFGALVPLAPGRNRLVVVARASDGSEASRELTVEHAPDAPEPVDLPRALVPQRDRLLQQRRLELRSEGEAAVRAYAEQARRVLELEIDRERARARARARRQLKELELEPERRLEARGEGGG